VNPRRTETPAARARRPAARAGGRCALRACALGGLLALAAGALATGCQPHEAGGRPNVSAGPGVGGKRGTGGDPGAGGEPADGSGGDGGQAGGAGGEIVVVTDGGAGGARDAAGDRADDRADAALPGGTGGGGGRGSGGALGAGGFGLGGTGTGGDPGAGGASLDAALPPRDGGRACSAYAGGCLCVSGGASGGECSTSSVKTTTDDGAVCCDSGAVCHCQALACRSAPSQSLCTCGAAPLIDSTAPGARVAACPAPTGNGRCCLSTDLTQCVCLPFDCGEGERRVASCSPSTLAICAAGEQTAPACN